MQFIALYSAFYICRLRSTRPGDDSGSCAASRALMLRLRPPGRTCLRRMVSGKSHPQAGFYLLAERVDSEYEQPECPLLCLPDTSYFSHNMVL